MIQLNGVNSPIQRLMFSSLVNNETQPETVRLRPISQSKIHADSGLVFFKYYDNVDFPEFFFPRINKELLEDNILGSIV